MPKKTFPYKLYLLPVLIGAVIIFVFIRFTVPQFQQILTVRKELKVKQARLDELTKKSRALEAISKETLKDKLQTTQKALSSEKDVVGLFYTWARLKSETGVTSEGIQLSPGLVSTPSAQPKPGGPLRRDEATPSSSAAPQSKENKPPQPEAPKGTLSSFDIGIGVKGDFVSIRNLLDKIKEMNPLIAIPSVRLSFGGGAENRADLRILYYYQLLAPFSGKVDDPLSVLTGKEEELLAEIDRFPAYNELPQAATEGIVGKPNPFE